MSHLPAERDRSRRSIAGIITAAADGNTRIHVDGERNVFGRVDMTDPALPRARLSRSPPMTGRTAGTSGAPRFLRLGRLRR